MAGAGYKLFNTGDVLTAQQVNEYLQQQTVMVFANSTARTTALSGVLAEGMMSYLQDQNKVYVYDGSAWVETGASFPSQTGNSGKYLTTDGTNPSWATVSAGSLTLISTTTLSGATTTVSSIPTTYNSLFAIIYNVNPASNSQRFRCAPNGTTNITQNMGNVTSTWDGENGVYIYLSPVTGGGWGMKSGDTNNCFSLTIDNYSSSTNHKTFISYGTFLEDDSIYRPAMSGGGIATTTAITSLVFSMSSGNLNGGTVVLYGVK